MTPEENTVAPIWRVRPAVDADCEAIIAVDDEVDQFFGTARDYIRGEIGNVYEVVVVEDETGRVVGWLEGNSEADLYEELTRPTHPKPHAYVSQMLVSPQVRGQGAGLALMREFVRVAQTKGCTWLALRPKTGYEDDAARLAFFARCGLRELVAGEPNEGGLAAPLVDVMMALGVDP
jgi:ribosomal protein S18 acetylase RimI-like enzyme